MALQKKRTLLSVIPFFSLAFVIVSCGKDKDNLTAKEKQLTIREWKITDITRPKISNPAQDSSIMKTCSSDDRLAFGGGNKPFNLKDNTTKCDTSIFSYDNGIWSMNAAQDQVKLTGARRVQIWKVLLLNDSLMKVLWRDSLSVANNVLKTISLKNR